MNRVLDHIAKVQAKVDGLSKSEATKLDRDMAIDFSEHFGFQNAQSRAHASGKLTADEAMVVYRSLGESHSTTNGGWTKGTNLATKVTVTLLMGELLAR